MPLTTSFNSLFFLRGQPIGQRLFLFMLSLLDLYIHIRYVYLTVLVCMCCSNAHVKGFSLEIIFEISSRILSSIILLVGIEFRTSLRYPTSLTITPRLSLFQRIWHAQVNSVFSGLFFIYCTYYIMSSSWHYLSRNLCVSLYLH